MEPPLNIHGIPSHLNVISITSLWNLSGMLCTLIGICNITCMNSLINLAGIRMESTLNHYGVPIHLDGISIAYAWDLEESLWHPDTISEDVLGIQV